MSSPRPDPRSDRDSLLRSCFRELAGLALPTSCGGCGSAGPPWCERCDAELVAGVAGWPRPVFPDPCPPGLPPVWASSPYAGPLRGALVAFKDGDRRDLVRVLAPLLASALTAVLECDRVVAAALRGGGPVWLVPVPSSPRAIRSRGDVPLNTLLGTAIRHDARAGALPGQGAGLRVAGCLRLTRRVADQAGLDSGQRAANLDRAMTVRPRWAGSLERSVCVLVDDVLTTGATLVEAARALRAAGVRHLAGATVAATQRRRGHPFG